MAQFKLCPICQQEKIFRREVKTCGSRQCISIWRALSPSQRASATDHAGTKAAAMDVINYQTLSHTPTREEIDRLFQQAQAQQPTRPAEPHIPSKHFTAPGETVKRDNEVLERLFGPDAPGIVREDTPDDKDKEK